MSWTLSFEGTHAHTGSKGPIGGPGTKAFGNPGPVSSSITERKGVAIGRLALRNAASDTEHPKRSRNSVQTTSLLMCASTTSSAWLEI